MDEAELTPRKIVEYLNRYIIGQDAAKKAVAIAIRNRWRRKQLPPPLRNEVAPKNILMIGPTGVGKTEIARRLSNLIEAPFLKIEASKYTEVGYVGRDVESMVRDLVEVSFNQVRTKETERLRKSARKNAEKQIINSLLQNTDYSSKLPTTNPSTLRKMLREGLLDDYKVEIDVLVRQTPTIHLFGPSGIEHLGFDIQSFFEGMSPQREQRRKMKVKEAIEILTEREAEEKLDKEKIRKEALRRAEESGIIFIDELDKIAGREKGAGPDVSREGVQRDLLPILEGTTVLTRHGPIQTDHILFIGAGAFNVSKPSDLIPELQGRFPIRVELKPLNEEDFYRIITEPENALTKQYSALLKTEGVQIQFQNEALHEIARIAAEINKKTENIGARRLYTVFEKLLEKLLFDAPDMPGAKIVITKDYVHKNLAEIAKDTDLSRYIL